MHKLTFAALSVLVLNTAVKADVAPEPYEPTNPTFWIVIAVIIIGAGVFFYRRRKS